MTSSHNLTAAIYIRKSREEKDKPSHRLTVQREQLPAYAKAQGWAVEIYDDGHASAARGKAENLPERARLESDIRSGKINVILCIELSRLSRDDTLQDYVAWLTLCSDNRVKLATMSRILDPSQHSDWMLLLMEGGFSSVEMKVLKARMKEGRDEAWRSGKWLGGSPPPPYRYDLSASRPVIDPEQLPQIQKLWKMAETMSAKAIAETIGIPQIAVRRAISDERLLMYQAKRLDTENLQTIPCDWEPCMTAEQALKIRSGRRSRKNLHGRKAAYASLLSAMNLVYCGYCHNTVKTWQGKTKQSGDRSDYYGCQKKDGRTCRVSRMVRQDDLNRAVIENMLNTLDNMADLQRYWEASTSGGDANKQLSVLEKQQRAEEQKKKRLIDAVSAGAIELSDVRQKMQQINDGIETIKLQRKQILLQENVSPDWDALSITNEEFHRLDINNQREFIHLAIKRIDVYNHYAVITYPFPRSETGIRTSRVYFPTR